MESIKDIGVLTTDLLRESNINELKSSDESDEDSDENQERLMKLTKKELLKQRNNELAELWNPEAKTEKYGIEKRKRLNRIQDAIYQKVKTGVLS